MTRKTVKPKTPRTYRFSSKFRREYPCAKAFLAPQERKTPR